MSLPRWILDGKDERDVYFGEKRGIDCIGTWCEADLIALRDLLNREFPPGSEYPPEGWASPGAIAAVAEYASHRERREKIATAVLAGLMANHVCSGDEARFAALSVKQADALITRLDESEP